ncbi:SirB2 family protein [Serratia sp. M24T3]|uniref:SirB2 family protein n=1 Tax=Rouxiella sp. WC2420 TaxID=3234145 RepID=A0AB39VKK6_9GAMM|nr:SirB2 family protein [Serratia sp. M24T3]EIC85970.1 Invasion gene expression up-regulator SirB [Serratia sp. M24T3]
MSSYIWVKDFHILFITVSIVLFILRFFWKWANADIMQKRWVKIAPHIVDTFMLVSGVWLVVITHFYPFTPQGSWLTEKLIGVIIYIALGFVALGTGKDGLRSQKTRWVAFILALGCLYLVVKLALTKIPLLMG